MLAGDYWQDYGTLNDRANLPRPKSNSIRRFMIIFTEHMDVPLDSFMNWISGLAALIVGVFVFTLFCPRKRGR